MDISSSARPALRPFPTCVHRIASPETIGLHHFRRPAPLQSAIESAHRPPIVYWPAITLAGFFCLWLMIGGIVLAACYGKHRPIPSEEQINDGSVPVFGVSGNSDTSSIASMPDTSNSEESTEKTDPSSTAEAPALSAADLVAPLSQEQIDPFANDAPALAPHQTPARGPEACKRYGTAVDFVDNPTDAAQQALRQKKLLFVLNVAGNFEDDKFT